MRGGGLLSKIRYITLILKLGTQTKTGFYRFLQKIFCESEIITVISRKNWSYVQNFGTLEFRESGLAHNGHPIYDPFYIYRGAYYDVIGLVV